MEDNFTPLKPENLKNLTEAGVILNPPAPDPLFWMTPEQSEKKEIRSKMKKIGIALIVMLVLMQFWVFPVIYGGQFLGFSLKDIYTLFENDYFLNTAQIILSSFSFTVPFIIVAKASKRSISGLIPLSRPTKGTALPFFLFGISFCALANVFTSVSDSFFDGILRMFGLRYELSSETSERGILIFVLSFLATAVVPALVEEFACRGVILGLLKEHGEGFAVILTSILFGLIHGNFVQIPFAFAVGLILSIIRIKTGTLWVACAVHFCNNLVSVVFEYLLYSVPDSIQNVIYLIYLITCMLLGIVGIYLISSRDKSLFKLNNNEKGISAKPLLITALKSPLIIILFVLYGLISLSFFSF